MSCAISAALVRARRNRGSRGANTTVRRSILHKISEDIDLPLENHFKSYRKVGNRRCCRSVPRNPFDTVLIPSQLVVDTCYATFVKLEGDKLGEEEAKATWERRLAMVASNRDSDGGEQEAFVVSKYDLLPESLADMVQVGLTVELWEMVTPTK